MKIEFTLEDGSKRVYDSETSVRHASMSIYESCRAATIGRGCLFPNGNGWIRITGVQELPGDETNPHHRERESLPVSEMPS